MKKKTFTDHEIQLRKVVGITTAAIKVCMDLSKGEKNTETLLAIHKACIVSIAEHLRPILKELAEEERVNNEKSDD